MEATSYTLLECNRLRAGINEDGDTYKNKWTNNVNSSGILVKKGDVINLESTAINTIGSTSQTIEFSGSTNENGFIDNKIGLRFSYYINNTGRNIIPLPFKNQPVFRSYDTTPKFATKEYLLNRGLGEFGFHETQAGANSTNKFVQPNGKLDYALLYRVELSKIAGAQTGIGYIEGETYKAQTLEFDGSEPPGVQLVPLPAGEWGFRVKVLEVTSEGTNQGIPTRIEVTNVGRYFDSPDVNPSPTALYGDSSKQRLRLQTPVSSTVPAPTQGQDIEVTLTNDNIFSKQKCSPDGKRYYFQDGNYTGCQINFSGITGLTPSITKRKQVVNLEVPIGLSDPDTIGTILTQQLTEPTRLNQDFSKARFLSGLYLEMVVGNEEDNKEVTPTIIQTPLYQPMPCNTANSRQTSENNLSGFSSGRRTYYHNVVWSNLDKMKGLHFSRDFFYGLNQDDQNNELHSGTEEAINRGDFNGYDGNTGQTIGNVGLNQTILTDFTNTTNGRVDWGQGEWVLSNVYYTEDTVKKIADGFKIAERYYGRSSNIIVNDQLTPEQMEDLAIAFDLCLYEDFQSVGRTLIDNAQDQRKRFLTWLEFSKGGLTTDVKNVASSGYAKGTIPFSNIDYQEHRQNLYNDGLELSSIVVTSRWRDEFDYRNKTDSTFSNSFTHLQSQADAYKFRYSATQTEEDAFVRNYTDAKYGYQTFDSLIALAKKYDVAVIPMFPEKGSDWDKHGGRPFIAYRSHLTLGEGQYNPDLNGSAANNKWQIDRMNCPYGSQMGLDVSCIRNECGMVYNLNYAATFENNNFIVTSGTKTYPQFVMCGASNPSINYNPTLSRFEISGLNTPIDIGNGQIQGSQRSLIAENNPDSQVVNINTTGTIARSLITLPTPSDFLEAGFPNITQVEGSILDSYCGVGIEEIILTKGDNSTTTLSYLGQGLITQGSEITSTTPYPTWTDDTIRNTILGKMGFLTSQLLTRNGSNSGVFNNELTYLQQTSRTYKDILLNVPSPLTTGAFFGSSEYQASATNSINLPVFSNSGNTGLSSRPLVNQGSITAFKLPQKLDYPYLNVYSSIVTNGTNTTYYGGSDGKSKINCVGYVTRFNNEGDFFYQVASNFSFTSTKDFVLTDIDTDIRLPDGSRPRLEPHSSVIYKISSNEILSLPPPLEEPKK